MDPALTCKSNKCSTFISIFVTPMSITSCLTSNDDASVHHNLNVLQVPVSVSMNLSLPLGKVGCQRNKLVTRADRSLPCLNDNCSGFLLKRWFRSMFMRWEFCCVSIDMCLRCFCYCTMMKDRVCGIKPLCDIDAWKQSLHRQRTLHYPS